MSYYRYTYNKFKITKREVLFSIVIISIMLVIGLIIHGNINESLMLKYQKYNTALQIEDNKDIFTYGMSTNVGNAFIHGELKAIDTVTYPEIDGEYSYVKKIKERYTKHTRYVTKTKKVNGKTVTYREKETYWTWDEIDRWSQHCEKISFLDVEFEYGKIDFPYEKYITTIKESSKIRYVYYGTGTEYVGTLYATLTDDTIENTNFHVNKSIDETIEHLESVWELILFWIIWIPLTCGLVFGFYYLDNKWLEDKNNKNTYKRGNDYDYF